MSLGYGVVIFFYTYGGRVVTAPHQGMRAEKYTHTVHTNTNTNTYRKESIIMTINVTKSQQLTTAGRIVLDVTNFIKTRCDINYTITEQQAHELIEMAGKMRTITDTVVYADMMSLLAKLFAENPAAYMALRNAQVIINRDGADSSDNAKHTAINDLFTATTSTLDAPALREATIHTVPFSRVRATLNSTLK